MIMSDGIPGNLLHSFSRNHLIKEIHRKFTRPVQALTMEDVLGPWAPERTQETEDVPGSCLQINLALTVAIWGVKQQMKNLLSINFSLYESTYQIKMNKP